MPNIEKMLEFNRKFVAEERYRAYPATKSPRKKTVILSCMDTRLTELLLAALDFKNGDVKLIKNAGAVVSHPFGSVMRSLLIAVYELGAEEILVVGHHDCGMHGMDAARVLEKMAARGVEKKKFDFIRYCGVDIDKWLGGFADVETSVAESVNLIKNHPLLPNDIRVYGFVIEPETGFLTAIDN